MKRLKKITLAQFRNYSTVSYGFSNAVTCITGANGTGKTTLLEAIYYLCYTKSYFTGHQQNIAQKGTDGFRVEGVFELDGIDESIVCKWQQGKKELFANDVPYEKVTDHIGKYSAVMIAPDDLELLNGGSEQRRKWIDSVLCQTDRQYLESLLLYQRVLQQRNAWLKQEYARPKNDFSEIEYYDKQLVISGTYIFNERIKFVNHIIPVLGKNYRKLSGGKEQPNIEYHTQLTHDPLDVLLKNSLYHDVQMQRTLKGVHKDDLIFTLNELPVKQFASQGQKKSFLFALKLAQYSYLAEKQGQPPILLLDDIFEKLDGERITALMNIIESPDFGQVFLSDTDKERVIAAFSKGADIGFVEL